PDNLAMADQKLTDLAAFQTAIQRPRILLFKHSPICPISAIARAEFELFKVAHPDVPTLFVDVIGSRTLAREIAKLCGIEHESPQAILFASGEACWSASHAAITEGSLEAAWATRC